ncbi:unnamed protein product, partial [Mesorhabditis spiculigera]
MELFNRGICFEVISDSPQVSLRLQPKSNKDVDWFMVYKMPKEVDNSVIDIQQGLAFYYMDVNDQTALKPSPEALNSTSQAIAYTLNQFYAVKDDKSIFHVMFNDEPYGTVSMSSQQANRISSRIDPMKLAVQFGHTKGTLFFNGQTGVWLVHSVPKFPLRISTNIRILAYAQLKDIGTQLYYNHPDIYSSNLPTTMAAANPDLAKLITGDYQKGAAATSSMTLTTAGGQQFKSFAKSADFNDASGPRSLSKAGDVGSEVPLDCGNAYPVNDALSIKVGASLEFKYTKRPQQAGQVGAEDEPICLHWRY